MSDRGGIQCDEKTLPSLLEYWSRVEPETPAYVFVGEQNRTVLSRRDVFVLGGKMAARLRRLGVAKGDVVSNMLPSSPERIIYEFGILMVGGVSQTGLGYLSNADDTLELLKVAHTSAIVVQSDNKHANNILHKLFSTVKETNYGLSVHSPQLPILNKIIYSLSQNGTTFYDHLQDENDVFVEEVKPEDYAAIIETSGTSGICKQIPQSHASLVRFGQQMCSLLGDSASPLFNNRFPGWFPGYACVYACSGITRVMLDGREDRFPDILDVIRNERCRSAYLVPSEIEDVMESMSKIEVADSPLDTVLTGGQPISKKSTRIVGPLTRRAIIRYGMSEAMCISRMVVTSPDDFQDHCVGYPMPSYTVRVVDEAGNDVVCGQHGNILVKGDGIFHGYLSNRQRCGGEETCAKYPRTNPLSRNDLNKHSFTSDAWFQTDDIGYIDSDGKLFIHGRGSDAIMHGDEILYPYWLEDLIRKCPVVDDVTVVPIRDPVMCHKICVCVIPTRDHSDAVEKVKQFVERQFTVIPHEECSVTPEYYLLFDEFPFTRNSKLDRKKLSRDAERRLKLSDRMNNEQSQL